VALDRKSPPFVQKTHKGWGTLKDFCSGHNGAVVINQERAPTFAQKRHNEWAPGKGAWEENAKADPSSRSPSRFALGEQALLRMTRFIF
jgi:hypothetical protein